MSNYNKYDRYQGKPQQQRDLSYTNQAADTATAKDRRLLIWYMIGAISVLALSVTLYIGFRIGRNYGENNRIVDPSSSAAEQSEIPSVIISSPTSEPTPEPTLEPTPEPTPVPGPNAADLNGCNENIQYPNGTWLSEYEVKYLKTRHGVRAYLRFRPEEPKGTIQEGVDFYAYVYEGASVVVLARENGFSLVMTTDGMAGWVTSALLVDRY